MENSELLFETNSIKLNSKNILIKNGYAIFKNKNKRFGGKSIRQLLAFIYTLHEKYRNIKIPIFISLENVVFSDKLTYVFLEIICDILISKYRHPVIVHFSCENNIFIEGLASSPLLLLNSNNKQNREKFLKKFNDDLFGNHYRKVLHKGSDKSALSKKMDEIAYFLTYLGVEKICVDELAEVIAELIGNAWEHASNECLVDVDVTRPYIKRESKSQETFVGVNVAVVNFSSELLGGPLKTRILNDNNPLPERYIEVKKAYERHSTQFDNTYLEEDFFNIASFQHKISGRCDKRTTGGTGLTKLIGSLEKRSDAHNCYLITGNRILCFMHQYLEYNDQGWIGFNDTNDFLRDKPSPFVLGTTAIYMPGTAYNLNFVLKGREAKWTIL